MRAQAARAGGAGSFKFGEIYLLANEYQLILISFQAINTQPELKNFWLRRLVPLIDSFWFNEASFRSFFRLELIGIFKINVWGSYYCKSAVFIDFLLDGIFFQCNPRKHSSLSQGERSSLCHFESCSRGKKSLCGHVLHSWIQGG